MAGLRHLPWGGSSGTPLAFGNGVGCAGRSCGGPRSARPDSGGEDVTWWRAWVLPDFPPAPSPREARSVEAWCWGPREASRAAGWAVSQLFHGGWCPRAGVARQTTGSISCPRAGVLSPQPEPPVHDGRAPGPLRWDEGQGEQLQSEGEAGK